MEIKNLTSKMINVMQEVNYIQKNGFNTFHRYKYATEADITSAFSEAFRKHKIFMFSTVLERNCSTYKNKKNEEWFMVTVKIQITFVDAESGEQFTVEFYGDGTDPGDKAIYKALTGAQKYALMKTFLVSTGDDPEEEKHENFIEYKRKPIGEPISDKRDALIEVMELKAHLGIESLKEGWNELSVEEKRLISPELERLKKISSSNGKYTEGEGVG